MCKIPFSRECGRGVCNVEGYAPTPILLIYCSLVEGELWMVTHDFGCCFLLTAGVLSPPHSMSFYAVHQVLTFIIILSPLPLPKNKIGP